MTVCVFSTKTSFFETDSKLIPKELVISGFYARPKRIGEYISFDHTFQKF